MLACCGRLVPVVGSFFSYLSHQHLLGRGHSSIVSSCLLRLVRSVYHPALRRGRSPRSSCVGMWGRSCLLRARRILYHLCPVPRAVRLPVSLLFVIRPVLRHGGRGEVLRLSSSAGSSPVPLLAVRGAGWRVRLACYHHGLFLPWWCAVWIVWLGCLLAVPMVYWYCQLVVYIVRLDF